MEEADEQPASREPPPAGRGGGEDCESGGGGIRDPEDDDLDIYGDGNEPQVISSFLPPPPEPPRMLVEFVNDELCEETDDDISHKPGDSSDCSAPPSRVFSSPVSESEIYDPAEPCMDSDDDDVVPVKPVNKVVEEEIPLPPGSPTGKLEDSRTNVVVSYSSTDSSGCDSGREVKSKRGGRREKLSSWPVSGEEGSSLSRLGPSSPGCQTVAEEAASVKVGENLVSRPDSKLSEQSLEMGVQKVANEFSVADSLVTDSGKTGGKFCKVCSKGISEGASESLRVCSCGSGSKNEARRKRKGSGGVNDGSTSTSLGSSSSSSSCSSSNNSNSSSSCSSDPDERLDKTGRDAGGRRKKRRRKNRNLKIQKENVDTAGDFQFNSKRDKFCMDVAVKGAVVAEEKCKDIETDKNEGSNKVSTRNAAENLVQDTAAQLGLEGLDTESISENEAFNFDDYCSQSENDRDSGELIESVPPRKKRKVRNRVADIRQSTSELDIFKELTDNISLPKLDWSGEDGVGKKVCDAKEDRMVERKGKKYEKENATNDGMEISKKSIFDKKGKKVNQAEIVSNLESKDSTISWKKISLEGKERNYRDSKMSRSGEKEKDYHGVKGVSNKKEKKRKEKRKEMERYDIRKVLNDKRKMGDRFGRDQSREYSFSRSRSRSNGLQHSRSRSVSRSKLRSPNRYRHRSKSRSRSRSYKSRRRLKNKARRKSKDRSSFSREKRRASKRDRSRSRNRRGSKSRSRSRSWNRSRSRSVVKSRKRQERGRNSAKSSQRVRGKRSWSRTWTPSWSRSRSGSSTSSSFSRSCSPPPRKFNRSFSHSFSRSWSREPHEHIPIPIKASTLVKPSKKRGIILAKPKEEELHIKKGKKKKDARAEKNKKRKERLIPASKEVFTSGDNILVSVNFNKSTRSSGLKTGDSSMLGSSCLTLPSKITSKKENFEITKELGKKPKKEIISGDKALEQGANADAAGDAASKPRKRVKKSLKEDKRYAAILKQKPIAVIDLDHSPFKERTPSPTDLIVLSDSNEEGAAAKCDTKAAGGNASGPELKKLCLDIPSPANKPAEPTPVRVPEVSVTTGPKTPPEPPSESSNLQPKSDLAEPTLPSREDSTQSSEKEFGRADEFDGHGATFPAPQTTADVSVSSPPGAYDPFDPTKSPTPSPGEQQNDAEDTAVNTVSVSNSRNAEEGNSQPIGHTTEVPTEGAKEKSGDASAECVSEANSNQAPANDGAKNSPEVPSTVTKIDVNIDVNNTVVNMEIDEADGPAIGRFTVEGDRNVAQAPLHQTVTTTVTQISAECSVTSVKCTETPVKPDLISNNTKLPLPLASNTPVKQHLHQAPQVTPPRNLAFLQLPPPSLSTPLIHPPPMLPVHPNVPLLSTPVHKQPDCSVGPFNVSSGGNLSLDQGLFLTSTPVASSKDGGALPNISNISAIANYLVSSLAATPQNPLLKQLNVSDASHHPGLASIPTPPAHNGDRKQQKTQDTTEVVDMDLDSPYSPASSEGDDLFEPPPETVNPTTIFPAVGTKPPQQQPPHKSSKPNRTTESNTLRPSAKADPLQTLFSTITKSANKTNLHTSSKSNTSLNKSKDRHAKGARKEIHIKRGADQLEILDELPSSAVELQVKEKFLKKLNRQERVVDEVKIALKPHYTKKYITKEEYKDILRRAVPKICHNEPGEINSAKVSSLIEAYVKKYRYAKKKFGGSHGGDNDKSSKSVM